jgi:serine/threonine-protein kinase
MATVHIGRASTGEGGARTVAIKRLHPHHASNPELVSMLLDEARIASFVVHPNVVRTLDLVVRDGEVLIVMEHVHGVTLAELLRVAWEGEQRVPIAVAAAIVADTLEGLQAAHEATDDAGAPLGIVHRDISPQNVIVGIDGRSRVLDFGVAKARGRIQDTPDGGLRGKPAYMAPEQLDGRATPATDVHATAVLLWEMLTSRRLYHADSTVETFSNVLKGRFEPPSRYRAGLSPALDRVTLQGLASEPDHRFASARDMVHALREATPVAPPQAVAAWVRAMGEARVQSLANTIAAMETRSGVRLRFRDEAGIASSEAASGSPVRRELRSRGAIVVAAIVVTAALTTAFIHMACTVPRLPENRVSGWNQSP